MKQEEIFKNYKLIINEFEPSSNKTKNISILIDFYIEFFNKFQKSFNELVKDDDDESFFDLIMGAGDSNLDWLDYRIFPMYNFGKMHDSSIDIGELKF
ncbi:hypothetical protein CANARDRAFT_30708 [[Candida] arabinofermentans NRRL YB-2248]|uniref:Uncharacterized protein n=1 Tax=[Candida] arabinofermentans NRRL YB-2248 TaxID=983967 RepID=A0A1E4SSY2_9ASCO|nr:hypothetical protein CANARDRAFT_30708 [[Candida] arabinofermentans NRRL YB-2248]